MPEFERDLQAIKEEVRARSDIVEVIGQYTQLKRSGKNWTGLCPFHADKKPSFSVSPAMQYYTCWSCSEKGDVFTFIEKKENLEFIEALEFLARRAGIPFERRGVGREQAGEREQMLAVNALAVRYFKERLGHSPDAQAYLSKRGILKSTQEEWDLGFAPNEWEGLSYYLQRARADLGIAAKLGLIRVREGNGGSYDTFRNRLIFPIHDIQGRVIAFGGRAMGDDPAKYLNSEQSPLFDKSRTLYGLVFARKAITPATPAVFVEGYVDVITAHQAGFRQCVATLGTSLTEEHARLLARYSPKVIICYDADAAGIKATLRGADVWESIGVEGSEVRVARLPQGEDPDSLILGGKTTLFQKALDDAMPRVDFEIELALKRHALDTEEGRGDALAEIIPILAKVSSLTQRDKYVEKVVHLHPAQRFDFKRALEAIHADVALHMRQSGSAKSARDRGFPLTEKTNRAPLANEPSPPAYRAPTPEGWGRWEPGTQNFERAGGTGRQGYQESRGRGGDGRYPKRQPRDPLCDYGPPSLALPPLSGAEKAERQLLRALFTPDWRSFVLGRVHPGLFITAQARDMFALAARMPARADGSLDPAQVFREAAALDTEGGPAAGAGADLSHPTDQSDQTDPSDEAAPSDMAPPEEMEGAALNPDSATDRAGAFGDNVAPAMSQRAANYRTSGKMPAKTSDFIREVLEDSLSVMSNEPLSDVVLRDCIRRLETHREEQAIRDLQEKLSRTDLSREERKAASLLLHEKKRQSRGSPPAVADDNG